MTTWRKDREVKKQIALGFLSVLILLFSFSTITFGQTEESDETVPVVVPDEAMEQVVRRILIWYFKPRNQKKVIYLAGKGLQNSWLPEIKGIEFQLLSETEVAEKTDVHFFAKLEERSPSKYHIGFAFGDPSCSYEADSWYFRISKQKVRLWKKNGEGFGAGCSRGDTGDNDS